MSCSFTTLFLFLNSTNVIFWPDILLTNDIQHYRFRSFSLQLKKMKITEKGRSELIFILKISCANLLLMVLMAWIRLFFFFFLLSFFFSSLKSIPQLNEVGAPAASSPSFFSKISKASWDFLDRSLQSESWPFVPTIKVLERVGALQALSIC